MKNKSKQLLAVLLALICLLTACSKTPKDTSSDGSGTSSGNTSTGEQGGENPDTDTSDTRLPSECITLYQNGSACFDIVHESGVEKDSSREAVINNFYTSICSTIAEIDGGDTAPKMSADSAYTPNPDRTVILYGETTYPESAQALENTALDEYGFCVINKKIVVYGRTMEELQMAGDALILHLNRNARLDENKKPLFEIAVDAATSYHTNLAICELPALTAGTDRLFCDVGDDTRMWVAEGCSASDFNAYLSTLQNASFTLYSQNEINGNLFATLTKDDIIVDVWLSYGGHIRVTASRGFDLLPKTTENYTKVCESGLTLVGSPTEGGQMLMFFRLEDGRFVIIDGGLGTEMGPVLYDALKEQALDPNHITVACWLFTHSHQDHIGAFQGIARNYKTAYADKLTIESFLYNFPGKEQAEVYTQVLGGTDVELRYYVNTYFKDSKVYKPHPGNEINFANMRVEILATHESYIFNKYPENYNACNLFLKITINGEVICIEGDADATNNRTLAKTYGNYLKCDILQADHHGSFGGVVETNRLFAPEVVLYFNTDEGTASLLSKDYNQALIDVNKNPNFKEYISVDTRITYLPLPYTPGSAVVLS